jgi:3-deoxy-7-phosphoheptulonate synthase
MYLKKAKALTGMPVVSEITNASQLELFIEFVDIIQVGARNMQNFELLKELGRIQKPVLLKRGFANSIEELLMSAEYIMSGGNSQIILCERGIRTFETSTRNTLDISAVPVLKSRTHLPVVIDPSHAGGAAWLVEPLSKAAVAVGADGLIIEVHNDPKHALSDGQQSLTPEAFDALMKKLAPVAAAVGRTI